MQISFHNIHKVYFVGIGGIAMSAAACFAKENGFGVYGSDSAAVYSPAKDVIDKAGIKYFQGYTEANIKQSGADLFILSAGEDLSNPEVKYIIDHNLPRCGFPEFMFFLAKSRLRIVVTGTNGKSTTAGFLSHVLSGLDDSSFLVGGVLQGTQKNFHSGQGHYFIFEGDEYKTQFDDPTPKFHYYKPDILVLTNLEFDHPDLFSSYEEMEKEFEQLISDLPADGLIVYNNDDINLSRLVRNSEVASVSFAIENESDYKVSQISYEKAYTTFQVINKFSKNITSQIFGQVEEYKIQLPGKLNVYNAAAAVATLRALGFQPQDIQLDLLSFKGIKRRFELVSKKNGITLIDDYAHHPTAIKETLDAARLRYPQSKIWVVFEPHTFSRTKATLDDLVKAFDLADIVLISEIYPAREKVSEASISSADVVSEIKKHNLKFQENNLLRLVRNKQEALSILKNELKAGDVVIVMAVGDFNRLAYDLDELL